MSSRYPFTSESVAEGHPDKVADQVSDAILDAVLAQDPHGRVACETLVKNNTVVLAGELSTTADIDPVAITRRAIREIGYTDPDTGFDADTCTVQVLLSQQSPEIAQGVDRGRPEDQGAGDQGLMFGYASDETPELMPLPIVLAHRLVQRQAELRKSGALPWLKPDAKSQVTVLYENGAPVGLDAVVLSTQHAREISRGELEEAVQEEILKPVLAAHGLKPDTRIHINPTGAFVLGGPVADAGVTGRKIIVDTYGGMARHGGGAFSGKDPSKVDRSAAYAARHVAKNIVAAGLAARCEVQIAYAIGVAEPVSVRVESFGTGKLDDERLAALVREVFDLRPGVLARELDLLRPIYQQTASYGHFGRPELDLPWERTSHAERLRELAR